MAFRTLFDHGYDAYLEENHHQGDFWFFLHIPKTAGSSFRSELAGLLRPEYNIHAYGDDQQGSVDSRLNRAMERFVAAGGPLKHRFASGHVPFRMLNPVLDAGGSTRLLTMLRDPIERVISDYRYQRTSQHPGHAEFRDRYPTIDDYLENGSEHDKMVRYLAPHGDARTDVIVDHLLDNFTFVGSLDHYDASFGLMMDLIGSNRVPGQHLRSTDKREAPDVPRTPALLDAIVDRNAGDVALYARLAPLLAQIGALRARSGDQAPAGGFHPWRDV